MFNPAISYPQHHKYCTRQRLLHEHLRILVLAGPRLGTYLSSDIGMVPKNAKVRNSTKICKLGFLRVAVPYGASVFRILLSSIRVKGVKGKLRRLSSWLALVACSRGLDMKDTGLRGREVGGGGVRPSAFNFSTFVMNSRLFVD